MQQRVQTPERNRAALVPLLRSSLHEETKLTQDSRCSPTSAEQIEIIPSLVMLAMLLLIQSSLPSQMQRYLNACG